MSMLRRTSFFAALAGLALALPGVATAVETYKIDPNHSEVGFTIRHFVSKVAGRFDKFEGQISVDPKDLSTLSFSGKIETATIDTNNEKRDTHLKSADFFEVEKYPEITFQSKSVTKKEDGVSVTADLTMKGVTKEVVLDVSSLGTVTDGRGNVHAGFEATGKVNRKDYGIVWNRPMEAGGFMLDDVVGLVIRVEAIKPAEAQPAAR